MPCDDREEVTAVLASLDGQHVEISSGLNYVVRVEGVLDTARLADGFALVLAERGRVWVPCTDVRRVTSGDRAWGPF